MAIVNERISLKKLIFLVFVVESLCMVRLCASFSHHATRKTFLLQSISNQRFDPTPTISKQYSFVTLYMADDSVATPAAEDDNNNIESTTPVSSPKQQKKNLDPLLVSVTRMDDDTMNAPTLKLPLWGDIILDRSLFLFLPLAGFAILGFLLSIYILINSGDEFVNAITENAKVQSLTTLKPIFSSDGTEIDTCRGLCSSQEQDLQNLKIYMNNLAGKK